jgi:type I restriction enzyme S subunit
MWRNTVELQSLCSRVTSGGTPLRSMPEYFEGGTIPWIKTGEVKQGFIHHAAEFITELGLENSSAKLIPANSLIVAMYGDGDTAGNVAVNRIPVTTNQACCNFVVDETKSHYLFLYYYLKANYQNLVNLKLGGSQQNLNAATLKRFPVPAIAPAIQKKISAILAAYDDLIANNQRRIAMLESMAEEIYREWFVRMRFPGAPYGLSRNNPPADWMLIELPRLASITYGFPFVGERFTDLAIGKKVIRIRDVLAGDSSTYTDEIADEKYVVQAGDLLIGMDGEFHMNHWIAEDAYLVQRTCRIRPKQERLRAYLALALEAPINHYQQIIVGATVGHLGAKHLNAIKLLVPSDDLNPYLKSLNGLLDQRILLSRQNLRLAKIRDALLPRLISGKLRVDQLDIQYPPSMRAELAQVA